MKTAIVTEAIVLSRRDFGEADRIVSVLTPDHGKLSFVAKGVRRPKSKLAAGIELFSVSTLNILPGRADLGTLISSRLDTHYGDIATDIQRTMMGYECIRHLNRFVEDAADAEYFELLHATLISLNDMSIDSSLTELWFLVQLLVVSGHTPNTETDIDGTPLAADAVYSFDSEAMTFALRSNGTYKANHIRLLRLAQTASTAGVLARVQGSSEYASALLPLLRSCAKRYTNS